jgi:hypothetical protein
MRVLTLLLIIGCGPADAPTSPPKANVAGSGVASAGSDSPFKACVRASMNWMFDEAAKKPGEPDPKRIEDLAVLGCEADNNCAGQQECDRKMNAENASKRQALERWK